MGGLRASLEQIRRADHEFSPRRFITGSQAAFEMVVEAFANGDTATLRPLLGDDVYDEFAAAIRDRLAEGHAQETTIVALDAAEIISAEMRASTARVTVKFVSQQINVVRDKDGEEVGGDPSLTERVTDIWTFARNTRSSEPQLGADRDQHPQLRAVIRRWSWVLAAVVILMQGCAPPT